MNSTIPEALRPAVIHAEAILSNLVELLADAERYQRSEGDVKRLVGEKLLDHLYGIQGSAPALSAELLAVGNAFIVVADNAVTQQFAEPSVHHLLEFVGRMLCSEVSEAVLCHVYPELREYRGEPTVPEAFEYAIPDALPCRADLRQHIDVVVASIPKCWATEKLSIHALNVLQASREREAVLAVERWNAAKVRRPKSPRKPRGRKPGEFAEQRAAFAAEHWAGGSIMGGWGAVLQLYREAYPDDLDVTAEKLRTAFQRGQVKRRNSV